MHRGSLSQCQTTIHMLYQSPPDKFPGGATVLPEPAGGAQDGHHHAHHAARARGPLQGPCTTHQWSGRMHACMHARGAWCKDVNGLHPSSSSHRTVHTHGPCPRASTSRSATCSTPTSSSSRTRLGPLSRTRTHTPALTTHPTQSLLLLYPQTRVPSRP